MKHSDLIGLPYKENGRGPDAYDCWGLVFEVSMRMGRILPDYGMVCAAASNAIEGFKPFFIEVVKPIVGDLIIIRTEPDRRHIAIIIEPGRFIQCTRSRGIETIALSHPFYKSRIEGYYRHE